MLPLTAILKLAAVRNYQAKSSFIAAAERKAGSILKSSVPSCGRGAGKITSGIFVCGHHASSSRVGQPWNTRQNVILKAIPHLAQKQVDPTAKNADGWRGEHCVQVSPMCSSPEQNHLDPRAGWVRTQRSGGVPVTWTAEGTSRESKLQYPRPGWSRAPRSGGVQLSWTAELATLSRARRHGRCIERGLSPGGCSGFVLGLLPRLLFLLLVCCTGRSIHVVGMGFLPTLLTLVLV